MSKKQEQPDGNPEMPETPKIEFEFTEDQGNISMLEMTYLINSILDYYTDDSDLDGDEWKKKTGQNVRSIPKSVDKEVEKAFISQLRKFQD